MSDHSQWLRGLAEKGGKGVVNNIDARCLGRIADEIDHLRPYVDAFRREEDRADKLGRDVDELREQLENCRLELAEEQRKHDLTSQAEVKWRKQLVQAKAVLEAYEQWEADIILENKCWTGQNVRLTDELSDRMTEIQGMRNKALGRFAQIDDLHQSAPLCDGSLPSGESGPSVTTATSGADTCALTEEKGKT